MLIRDVVRDDVDDRADAQLECLRDQLLGLGERPEGRIDGPVVRDVIAAVGQRRDVPGGEPNRVDPEIGQVVESRTHAGQVADAVAVAVRKAADVDLVDDRATPPLVVADEYIAGPRGCTDRPGSCWRACEYPVCHLDSAPVVRLVPLLRAPSVPREQSTLSDNLLQDLNKHS